ncbi:MAG TPA: Crp/Fnr family transcriptional regulator [Burkholderiales bacterium]|jgi:CRP-like cAMP-binding protein|nr:Crp/Fnr family transcriptional regulator [Burkholderiales bacterium]
MPKESSPLRNRILAALPAADYERLLPHLELIELPLGHSLYESGAKQPYVYFPIEGIVSLLYITQTGNSAELAVVGSEGMIGIALFMGGETAPNRAVVQSKCRAYRLPAQILKTQFSEGGALQLVLLKFTQALITQISQTAVCNLHHSVDQQLCRWLLLSLDRLPENRLQMTQELIANMLGVRRQGVTESARKLEQDQLITYSRGLITVLDRPGLEKRSCECYAAVKTETDRLLPQPSAP